jgi:ABC-type bacteriocin/lantibiotic exporter with double-glycine peptidase domain
MIVRSIMIILGILFAKSAVAFPAAERPCGIRSILRIHQILLPGHPLAEAIQKKINDGKVSHTFSELKDIASLMGMQGSIVRLDPWNTGELQSPIVAWLEAPHPGHFVVIRRFEDHWQLWDGSDIPRIVSLGWMARRWTGPALVFDAPSRTLHEWVALVYFSVSAIVLVATIAFVSQRRTA